MSIREGLSKADFIEALSNMGCGCSCPQKWYLRSPGDPRFAEEDVALHDYPRPRDEIDEMFAEDRRRREREQREQRQSGSQGQDTIARVSSAVVRGGQAEASRKQMAGGQSQARRGAQAGGSSHAAKPSQSTGASQAGGSGMGGGRHVPRRGQASGMYGLAGPFG